MSEEIPQSNRPDYIDTGQWHMAVDMSLHGFGAWLVPDAAIGRSPRVIICKEWAPSEEGLLNRIEDVVYDNPTVLDDYSADIIVECDRQLWLPAELYISDEDCAEAYTRIYGGNILDVMVCDLGKEKCAFMLAPGLKSFMQRSFPGARIWSQQVLLKEASKGIHDSFKCLVDIRDGSADFVLSERGKFLSASTHLWKTETDIAYTLFSIMQAYDVDPAQTDVIFSGIKDVRHSLGKTITPYFKTVSQKNHDLDGKTIPTAVYLAIDRKTKKQYAHHKR